MIHLIGYIAIVVNLISMTMNNVLNLRIISFLANGVYMIYGFLLQAPPIIIGGGIALLIHIIHIIKLRKAKK